MFEVRGLPLLASELDILYEIKRQVFATQNREILRKIRRTGNNIMVCCPNLEHAMGQERKPSCGITTVPIGDKPAGTVHCFTCGYVDDLIGFVSTCFDKPSRSFGERWLLENFVVGELDERPEIPLQFTRSNKLSKSVHNYITEEELCKYRFYHPYMWHRKLTPEIVEKYDVGYQKDFVLVTKNADGTDKLWPPIECLTFPVRDKFGNCLFVSRRSISGKSFYLPQDIEKPVYGIYELPENSDDVIICESVFNALTCVAYGRPALALFGTGADEQYQMLNKLSIRHYVLGLDPDKAGASGTWKLKKNLKGKILTKLVIPTGKDINDLNYEEFLSLNEIYI